MISTLRKTKPSRFARPEGYLLLEGISWECYEKLLDDLPPRGLRITYDFGSLEIMPISHLHEILNDALRRLIDVLIEELDIDYQCAGSMTFKRKSKLRGLAPDECFWFSYDRDLWEKKDYDPEKDPPPELVLEVDITSSSLNRISIYETFGVKEVWRRKDDRVEIRVLTKKGQLTLRKKSKAFAGVNADDLLPFLQIAVEKGKSKMVKEFRQWVRERIADGKIQFGAQK